MIYLRLNHLQVSVSLRVGRRWDRLEIVHSVEEIEVVLHVSLWQILVNVQS